MSTKLGLIALIGGGYILALGIAGVNANSGGARAFWAVVLALGFVIAGWGVVLPWDGGKPRQSHESPGPVPRP